MQVVAILENLYKLEWYENLITKKIFCEVIKSSRAKSLGVLAQKDYEL